MANTDGGLNIGGLTEGIVIDHITAVGAMKIYEYLQLDQLDCSVAIIKNAKSSKMKKKDIVKIEGPVTLDLDLIGVLEPSVTINIIKDSKIVGKYHPQLPESVSHVLRCKNPRCITSIEQEIVHVFKMTDNKKRSYRCIYCETKFE